MLSAAILANYSSSSSYTLIRDKRTNEYELTEGGYELLLGQLNWEFDKIAVNGERVDDLERLLADTA